MRLRIWFRHYHKYTWIVFVDENGMTHCMDLGQVLSWVGYDIGYCL